MTARRGWTFQSRVSRSIMTALLVVTMISISTVDVGAADSISGRSSTATPQLVNLGEGAIGLAADSVRNVIYVATFNGVQVISGRTNQVITVIHLPKIYGGYVGPAVDSRRDLIYVAGYSIDGPASSVYVIDGRTNKVIRKMSAGGPCQLGIAINPKTDLLYVPINRKGLVTVLDAATGKLVAKINVGGRPSTAAVDPTTNTIYVTQVEVGYGPALPVSVVDGGTNKVISTEYTGYMPLYLAVDQVTHRVYVADQAKSTVYVLTTSDHGRRTIKTGEIKLTAFAVAVDPFNHTVVVTGDNSGQVSFVNGSMNKVSRIVMVGGQPDLVTIDTTNHSAYVNVGTNRVAVIPGA